MRCMWIRVKPLSNRIVDKWTGIWAGLVDESVKTEVLYLTHHGWHDKDPSRSWPQLFSVVLSFLKPFTGKVRFQYKRKFSNRTKYSYNQSVNK